MIKYDKILGEEREKDIIPQLDSDPASPKQQDAWVLKASSGGTGAGEAFGFLSYTKAGDGASTTYTLKYRTKEDTTVSVALT